jgi:hypothetical protein
MTDRVKQAILMISLAITVTASSAQTPLPDAPQPAPDRIAQAGLAAAASARIGDWLTTRAMLQRGNRELILPSSIAHNSGGLAGVEVGMTMGDWLAGRWLARKGHRKWARIVAWGDAAGVTACDIRNLQLGGTAPKSGIKGLPKPPARLP